MKDRRTKFSSTLLKPHKEKLLQYVLKRTTFEHYKKKSWGVAKSTGRIYGGC